MNYTVKRGDVFYADLSPVVGSEQGGIRPILIIQNDIGNKYSPTVIAAAITSRMGKTKLPTHININRSIDHVTEGLGLAKDSVILLEQIRTLDKQRLKEKIGHLDELVMEKVDDAITISFGLKRSDIYSEKTAIVSGVPDTPGINDNTEINDENDTSKLLEPPDSAVTA